MAKEKKKIQQGHNIFLQHKGLIVFAVLYVAVFIFWLFGVKLFKPKLGQDALYLEALDIKGARSMLSIYDPSISLKVDFQGLPGAVLCTKEENRKKPLSFIDVPSGHLNYVVKDIVVNRQHVGFDKKGQIEITDREDPYLTFQRVFQSDSSSKSANIGYGWTHNFNFHLYNTGEVFTVVDWTGRKYSFSYDYREERFSQIFGLVSELIRKGQEVFWISPDRVHFIFRLSKKFSAYQLIKIKTQAGRLIELEHAEDTGKVASIRDTVNGLSLNFFYSVNGSVSRIDFAGKPAVQYAYDDYGNLSSAASLLHDRTETYAYKSLYDLRNLTKINGLALDLTFIYDPFDRVRAVIHPESKKMLLEYDDIFGIVTVRDLNGNAWKYACEGRAGLRVLDPLNHEHFLFFDKYQHIVKAVFSNDSYIVRNYNDAGKIIEEQKAPGHVAYFDYNPDSGMLSKQVNPLGKMIKFDFNEKGLPVTETGYKEKDIFAMEYDAWGRLTGLTDPSEVHYDITYDSRGNIQKVSDGSGWQNVYKYDVQGRLNVYIDAEGNKTEIFYDDRSGVTKTVFPDGMVQVEKYNEKGQLIQKTVNKKITQYSYNKAGNLVEIKDPLSRTASFTYDNMGNKTYQKNLFGREHEYKYDALCRLISQKDRVSEGITLYEYEEELGAEPKLFSRKFTRKIFPDGEILRKKYDNLLQVSEVIEPSGRKKELSYDKMGHIIKVKESEFSETVFSYDDAGNMESIFMPGNQIFLFEFNWRRQITAAADPEGHTFIYFYDSRGRLQKVLNAEKQTSSFFYDQNDNLTAFQFPDGLLYTYGYDEMDRLNMISKGEKNLTEISFNSEGNLYSIARSSGIFEIRERNTSGQLISRSFSDETLYNYSYDSFGQIRSVKGPDFNKLFEYDKSSRISRLSVNQQSFVFKYTKGGKISRISYPDKYEVSYQYDSRGLLKEVQDSTGDKILFKYDMRGQLQSMACSNRVTETWGYNDIGQISRIRVTSWKDEKILDARFDYNYRNRVSEMNITQLDRSKEDIRYKYDSLMRITQEKVGEKQSEYHYDPSGNLIEETSFLGTLKRFFESRNDHYLQKIHDSLFTGGAYIPLLGIMSERAPEYVNVDNTVCQIDKKKKMFYLDKFKLNPGKNIFSITAIDRIGYKETIKLRVSLDEKAAVTFGYYPDGNIQYIAKKGSMTVFEWNQQNRLHKLINDRREITTFGYYEDGRLASTMDDYGDMTQYLYGPKGRLLSEIQGKNSVTSKYVYAPDGRILFKVERGGKKYFYHLLPDASVKVITDRFGNVAKTYSYDVFGKVTDETGRIKNSLLFKSMFFDVYSQMYIIQGRYFSPEYRIYAGGGIQGAGFSENHISGESRFLGLDILEMHPDSRGVPLDILQKKIDLTYEY